MTINNDRSLVCPDCKNDLITIDGFFICHRCNKKYPIINEIPQFLEKEMFWFEPGITEKTMGKIIEELSCKNWHEVLSNHESEAVRNHYFFISNLERANWHNILNLGPNSIVMDLGAGTGTISHALSKHYKHIYSVEPVNLRCEFMKHRFAQENINNITIVRGDSQHLPFPDNFFDHIVLNGVLEWVPYSYKHMNPRKAQILVLKGLQRLLKPNGSISIGIENRFGIDFFLGNVDCHNAVRFVTILPRFLAHLICKIKINDIYRPYLYSWRGLENILLKSGFSDIKIYSSLPDYNDPLYTIRLDTRSEKFDEYIWKTKNILSLRVKRFLSALDILKYFGYAFRVTAVKKE